MKNIFNKLLNKIPFAYREWLFRKVGNSIGVSSFACNTPLGTFEGNINDWTVHGYLLKNKTWAPNLQFILLDHIFANQQGTYIDVGANIGLTSIPLAKFKSIKCYLFEPEPGNYTLLCKNILSNNVADKITAFNTALYSKTGKIEFEKSDVNMGDHRIQGFTNFALDNNQYDEGHRKIISVDTKKLDEIICESLPSPVVMKIDTQGAEVHVLKGAYSFLKHVDYLIMEYWPYGLRRLGSTPEEYMQVIGEFPYGAVYQDEIKLLPTLEPISSLIQRMNPIEKNGPSTEHLDIIVSKHSTYHQL